MILSEIWSEAGRLLNDPNNDRWSQAILTFRANQATAVIQNYTSALKTKETLTPTANSSEVSVDQETLDIVRVRWTEPSGTKRILEGFTKEELDYRYPNWENMAAGSPVAWWFDATNAKINLVPAPDTTNATSNALDVWEILKPTDMALSTDIPFDSNGPMVPYHMAIVHWIVAQCWMDDGTPEALSKARFHRSGILEKPGEFESQIMRILKDFDIPEAIPERILWRPQGGRVNSWSMRSKSAPFGW